MRIRKLSSTRHVAGLLQSLVVRCNLTHLLADDHTTICYMLRSLLVEARTHGHLGRWTFIDAEDSSQAAGSVSPVAALSSACPAGAVSPNGSAAGTSDACTVVICCCKSTCSQNRAYFMLTLAADYSSNAWTDAASCQIQLCES